MKSLFPADVTSLRFACLLGAVISYALLGSPTPDAPGFAEILVAVLLLVAAGVNGIYNALKPGRRQLLWEGAGRALLVYGFAVSLAVGVLRGHETGYILRDAVPFLFLLLPLFLHDIFTRRPQYRNFFLFAVAFAGVVFALRAAPEITGWWNPGTYSGELYYFANAPSVLFAALLLAGFGAQKLVQHFSLKTFFLCAVCFTFALIPLSAMTLSLQRASVGVFLIGMIMLTLAGLYRSPVRTILLLLVVAAASIPALPFLSEMKEVLVRKTGAVGLNMRSEELAAAWDEISTSPLSLLFGTGWGGTFESPAVAGIRVNYTHGLLSAMLLKTGLCGFLAGLAYLAGFAHILIRALRRNTVVVIALAGPIAIDVFLYASYKSLDFGLVLLLAAILAPAAPGAAEVASPRRVLYSNLYTRMSYE